MDTMTDTQQVNNTKLDRAVSNVKSKTNKQTNKQKALLHGQYTAADLLETLGAWNYDFCFY